MSANGAGSVPPTTSSKVGVRYSFCLLRLLVGGVGLSVGWRYGAVGVTVHLVYA